MPKFKFLVTKKQKTATQLFEEYRRAVTPEVKDATNFQKKSFENRVRRFKIEHKPIITKKITSSSGSVTGEVLVRDRVSRLTIWKWLFITGTRPHEIKPVRASILRFKTGYSAKFRGGTGTFSGGTVFSSRVHHPGFAPEPFISSVVKQTKRKLLSGLHRALRKEIKA